MSSTLGLATVKKWTAKESRFHTERKKFDFETLNFKVNQETNTDITSEYLSEEKSSHLDESQNDESYILSLDVATSQRLIVKSRDSLGTKPTGRSRRKVAEKDLAVDTVHMVGREKEVKDLLNAYKDDKTRMAIIIGESGCGKTMLAKELRQAVIKDNGIFCLGKFDVQNRADPYHALVTAIDEFVKLVERNKEFLEEKRELLNEKLSKGQVTLLLELLPSLCVFLDEEAPDKKAKRKRTSRKRKSDIAVAERNITDRGRRIQQAFLEFLRLVCTEEHPFTMLLDDIQWAGKASLELVDTLMTAEDLEHFFIVSTCRAEYVIPSSNDMSSLNMGPLNSKGGQELLQFLSKHAERLHQLRLSTLNCQQVQNIINALLRLPDDDSKTDGLAGTVHRKTDGNPFFVLEFMRVIKDDELLTFNEALYEWEWFEAEISSLDVASNVADTVQRRLRKLSSSDLLVAQVSSCISKNVEPDMIEFVIEGLQSTFEDDWTDVQWPDDLAAAFQNLEESGVVERPIYGRHLDFVHDQIQHAAFKTIPKERVPYLKAAIGRRLISGLDSYRRDQILFTAVELSGVGIEGMSDLEKFDFAFWSFFAGDTAIRQGAFQAALRFFEKSIECLGDEPFDKDPELSLPLFSGAAEAAFSVTDYDKAFEYIRMVKKQSDVPMIKKVRVAIIELKIHDTRQERTEGCKVVRDTVELLGLGKLPSKPGMSAVLYQITKTNMALKKFKGDLVSLSPSTDPALDAALNAFSEAMPALFNSVPNLFVVATCKGVRWSLRGGVVRYTPIALACLATLLGAMGSIDKAIELGEVALELCDIHGYTEALPMTVLMIFGYIRHWKNPLQDFVSPVNYARQLAVKNGQVSMILNTDYIYQAMSVQTQMGCLSELIPELEGYVKKAVDLGGRASGVEINLQFLIKLAYPGRNSASLDGDVITKAEMLRFSKENQEVLLPFAYAMYQLQLEMYVGDPVAGAKESKMVATIGVSEASGSHYVTRATFVAGMVNALAYEKTKKKKYLKMFNAMRKRLKTWTKKKNPNSLHLLKFLNAENEKIKGNTKLTKTFYSEAIVASRRSGYQLDFAQANERMALFSTNPLTRLCFKNTLKTQSRRMMHTVLGPKSLS